MIGIYQFQSLQRMDWHFNTNGIWRQFFTWNIQHSSNDQYVPEERTSEPSWFNQWELNDFIRDLSLSIDKAELLASRLKERSLLENDVRVCQFWIQNNVLKTLFRVDGPMVFCHDIGSLSKGLKQVHNPSDWRLFSDSSWWSLKAALLHNGNFKPSIPVVHSVHAKESYGNMKILLEAIQCNAHQWNMCGYLKVTGMLMGMQGGFMKFCFLCLQDSHSAAELYIKFD
jgi:hypothetical protein